MVQRAKPFLNSEITSCGLLLARITDSRVGLNKQREGIMNEADKCQPMITFQLRTAGWTDEQIREQVTFTHGRIVTTQGKIQKCGDYLVYYQGNSKKFLIPVPRSTNSGALSLISMGCRQRLMHCGSCSPRAGRSCLR